MVRTAVVIAAMVLSTLTNGQAPPVSPKSTKSQATVSPQPVVSAQQPPIAIQLVQPPAQQKNPWLETVQAYAPWGAAALALIGVIGTAIYTLRRGRMDARYAYASEIMKFRVRQIQEFYAPALLHIEQSRIVYEKLLWTLEQERADVSLSGFRLLDRIHELQSDPAVKPLIDRILVIGKQLTNLISKKAGLIEGGLAPTFIEYQGHFEILNAASEQDLSPRQREGWHEFGYYPRMLNREIREGYKVVLAHLENYTKAGDQIISKLLKQRALDLNRYRQQLIDNLQYYEDHSRDYAAKFDSFNLSVVRQRFIDELEATRTARRADEMLKILDAGCGTGRDSQDFLERGYAVTGIDASPAMLREYKRKLREALQNPENEGMRVAAQASCSLERTFDELAFRSEFDGVWAAASLLHVPPERMEESLRKLMQALKPGGILYISFKYGRGTHEYDARFYSSYGRRGIRSLLARLPDAEVVHVKLSDAEGRFLPHGREARAWLFEYVNQYDRHLWLNVLVRRRRG